MTKRDELTVLLAAFKASEQYPNEGQEFDSVVRTAVTTLWNLITPVAGTQVSRWRSEDITALMRTMVENHAPDVGSSAELGTLQIFLLVIKQFARFLAASGRMDATVGELDRELDNFQNWLTTLAADAVDDDGPQRYDVPGLPQWLPRIAEDIQRYVHEWLAAYYRSPEWQQRPTGLTQQLLELFVDTLTEGAYDTYRKTPKSWTKYAIEGVLTEKLVRNVDLSVEDYQLVEPALTGFIGYVSSQGWLNAKRAASYQRYIHAVVPAMLEAAEDPTNYSASKLLVNSMRTHNVDLDDPSAVQKYINDVNAKGGVESLAFDESYPDFESLLAQPERLKEFTELFDPDPQKSYLKEHHFSGIENGQRWRRSVAERNHVAGVKLGLYFWAAKSGDLAWNGREITDVVEFTVLLADMFYQTDGVQLTEWSATVMTKLGHWLRDESAGTAQEQPADMVKLLIPVMVDQGLISASREKELTDAFTGIKAQSKVISLRQARKLRRRKKRR